MIETVPLEYKLEAENAPPVIGYVYAMMSPVECNPEQLISPLESMSPHCICLLSSIDIVGVEADIPPAPAVMPLDVMLPHDRELVPIERDPLRVPPARGK